jgi:N-acetylglucosaminyl-diphospho-decaprenol L-rhamnosyltransferase
MLLTKQILSVVIVTFKSDKVIHACIKSIPDSIEIIIIDNSNDKSFKDKIEKKYSNVKCHLSSKNLGMGAGNNLGLKYVKTDYAFILNPDSILYKNTVYQIIDELNNNDHISILAPLSDDKNYPNYKAYDYNLKNINSKKLLNVKSVDGYAMVLNLKKLKNILDLKENKFFDESFFMYLENDDLCKRVTDKGEKIYILTKSKVKHIGARAVDPKYNYEIELSRNWHWIWSKFYFNKKHYGYPKAFLSGLPNFISGILKFLFYSFINNKYKKNIYLKRITGFIHSVVGKESSYRPKI